MQTLFYDPFTLTPTLHYKMIDMEICLFNNSLFAQFHFSQGEVTFGVKC